MLFRRSNRISQDNIYEVTLPDGKIKLLTLPARATGNDCIKLLCRSLGVLDEANYFGLTHSGSQGEELWVNSRNPLVKQLPRRSRCRLRLAVRFFAEPHILVEEETRQLFLLEAQRRAGQEASLATTLKALSQRPDYGCHFYAAKDCQRRKFQIGVNSAAVLICTESRDVLQRYAFPRVEKVTRSGRLVHLLLSNQGGCQREFGFRLVSGKAAEGLYRCVTEMHSFFRCDTVRSELLARELPSHRQRHVKPTAALAALIKGTASEDDCAIREFAFDVGRTAREVHDLARRRQFQLLRLASKTATFLTETADATETLAALSSRLQTLQQEQTCSLCADQPISVVLVPCGHMFACSNCSQLLDNCPLCRCSISFRQVALMP